MTTYKATTIHELAAEVDASEINSRSRDFHEPEAVQEVLDSIENYEIKSDQDDELFEMCDSLVDVYNSDLLEWVAKYDHDGYVQDAISQGLADGTDFYRSIMAGQFEWYREIAQACLDALTELLEELEDERLEAGVLLSSYYTKDGEPVEESVFSLAWDEVVSTVMAEFDVTGLGYYKATGLDQDEVDELISTVFDEGGDEFQVNYVSEAEED
jgi:hypothetical protein